MEIQNWEGRRVGVPEFTFKKQEIWDGDTPSLPINPNTVKIIYC